jgi:hypothetical protein
MAWGPLATVSEFLTIHVYSWQAFFAFLACYGTSVVLQWQIQAYFWDHPERAIERREKVYARGWWRYVDWRLFMLWATGYDGVAAAGDSSSGTAIYGGDTCIADSVGNTVLVGYVPPSPHLPASPPPHTLDDDDDDDGGDTGKAFPKYVARCRQGGLATIREV